MVAAREIEDRAMLAAIGRGGEGCVFNPDGRRLHAASCETVAAMGLGTRKLFFPSTEAAIAELDKAYGAAGWSWCPLPACRREAAGAGGSESAEATSELERETALLAE